MAKSDFQQFNAPFSHRICDRLDLSDDICRSCGYVEIIPECCALVDGCKGVMEYGDTTVKLNLGRRTVTVSGSDLVIKSLSMEQAMIEGLILNIEFDG